MIGLALATNCAEFVVAMIATHKRRAIFTPVNTELIGSFLEHQVRNSEPRVLLVVPELIGSFALVDTAGLDIGHIIVIGDAVPADTPESLRLAPISTWSSLRPLEVVGWGVLGF